MGDVRFLVTGGGGRVGGTGTHAVQQLIARKLPVRAFVHHADERTERLRSLGAEILVGDLRDFASVRAAMKGVHRAYFVYPTEDSLVLATTIFAAAGKEAALEAVVNMSQITARPDHPSPASRQHWLADLVFDWSGIGVTHLRPPFFLENLLLFAAQTIRNEAKIFLPFGHGRHAPIAADDIARVAVSVLVDPGPHRGKTYVPTGPRSLSMAEMAATFARLLGHTVQYVDVAVDRWRQVLASDPLLSPYSIEHLARVAEAHQRGEFDAVTDVVQKIGGASPKSLEAFIAENGATFGVGAASEPPGAAPPI